MASSSEISAEDLCKKLRALTTGMSLEITAEQNQKLVEYLFELSKWNRVYNLTAVKGVEAMLSHHILDCLAILPALIDYQLKTGTDFRTIVDVGSGPGLPAVVLAVCMPKSAVVSVDAVEKKTTFVSHVSNRLGLVNLCAQQARIETMAGGQADLVVSRAFASLAQFVQTAGHLANERGVMAAMKSKQLEAERIALEAANTGWCIDRIDTVEVPDLNATRFLAWLKRKVDNE